MNVIWENRVRLALGIILLIAAGLRLYELNWDEGQHTHPDERWIAMVAPSITWPERASDLLDPRRSTLNPLWIPGGQRIGLEPAKGDGQVRNFAYGHLPLYLQSLVGHALASVGQELFKWGPRYYEVARELQTCGEYGGISLVGRFLSALFDLGTIYLVYLLGKRVYGEHTGLLGAALVAFAVMHIQLAHFATFDVMTTFFITLSVHGAVCVAQAEEKSWWPTVWSGAVAGFAVASKFSAIPLLAVLVVAQIIRAARHTDLQNACPELAEGRHTVIYVFRHSAPNILLSLLVALLAFFLVSPFAILDYKLYLKQVIEQGAMVRGEADWPFTRQYYNTTPFLYQIIQQVRWGLGWPLGITAFAGFGWVIIRHFGLARQFYCSQAVHSSHFSPTSHSPHPSSTAHGPHPSSTAHGPHPSSTAHSPRPGGARWLGHPCAEELVLLSWTVPYFLLTSTFMVKFMRYMLPLLPLFILMGAAMMYQVSRWASGRIANRKSQIANRNGQTTNCGLRIGKLQICRFADFSFWIPHFVLVASILYALAFTWIYAQEHPWIQASKWIYAHLPNGSLIAVEHWDDNLPLSLPIDLANPGAHQYTHVELPMYEPDGYAKYDLIRSRLRAADYVVFSTNRLYRTIPRLPERYPVSTEFYRLFFAEKLGYVREKEFTAYPGLLGLQIVDDDADESFTVYDHPKPIAFRKVRDLDDLEWDALFRESLMKQPVWEVGKQEKESNLFGFLDREPPVEGEAKPTLLLDRPVGELPVVADFGWNHWASNSTVGATLLWWLVVAILGWLAWPITFAVFGGLRDRGYLLSRSVALLVVGYLVWLPAGLHWLQNGLPLTYAAIGVMTLVAGLMLWRNWARMKAFVSHRWRTVLLGEMVFGLALLLFVGIRVLNPDLWHPWNGGEKGMDIAYLNACMRSAYAPPYDPYYSGGYLNYYYYGQFLLSILTRLTGITTSVAFNLSVPLLFALTVCNAFSIGYTLAGTKRRLTPPCQRQPNQKEQVSVRFGIGHGLLVVLCITILGNLASATQIIGRLGNISQSVFTSQIPGLQATVRAVAGVGQILLHGARFPSFNYWDPSRVVGYTINEFPYWSFLFADLHPHMMNIPFTLLILALALNWLRRERAPVRPNLSLDGGMSSAELLPNGEITLLRSSFRYVWQRLDWGEVLSWVLWPLTLGALAMINTWDMPAYAGVSGLILLFVWIRERGKQGIIPALVAGGALAVGGLLLYAPFFKYYTAVYVGLGWSLGRTHTDIGEFLAVWGFLLFAALSVLFVLWGTQRSQWGILRLIRMVVRYMPRLHRMDALYGLLVRQTALGYRLSIWGVALLVLALAGLAWKGYWLLVFMVPLLLLAAVLMVQARMSDEWRFIVALMFTAFLILVGIELFYLKDFLDGDQTGWWRMNTLFKFYMQVWVMLGVAVGAALPWLWQAVERWKAGWRRVWTGAFMLLLFAAALFPALGTPVRVLERFPNAHPPIGTLDGMEFMTVGVYTWPDEDNPIPLRGDYEAIRWLRDNVQGTPVLAEAPIGYYREFGVRVASYTGLPTLLGMHESEQRYGWQVGQRSGQANELFMSADLQRTVELLHELDVEYVYIGPLERTLYPHSVEKFGQLAFHKFLSVVYENDLVTIYEVEQ